MAGTGEPLTVSLRELKTSLSNSTAMRDNGTKHSSSIVNWSRWDSYRCRLSDILSPWPTIVSWTNPAVAMMPTDVSYRQSKLVCAPAALADPKGLTQVS